MMRHYLYLWLFAVVISSTALSGIPPALDQLVIDLESGDNGTLQARARQVLPSYGIGAAEKMIPLLTHANQKTAAAALRVLEDILHESIHQATQEEQQCLSALIVSLLAPETTDQQKVLALQLLPYVPYLQIPLDNLSALLQQEAWREATRTALQQLQSPQAHELLCEALNDADDSFKVALLRSIAAFPPEALCPELKKYLDAPSDAVRAAALRALAKTGDPDLLPRAQQICEEVSEEYAFDAWDGRLRLNDALAERGGMWEQVMESYRNILKHAPYTLIQGGAIIGLGRYGDSGSISMIMDALDEDKEGVLEAAALEAFRALKGREVRMELAAVWAHCSATMKIGFVQLFADHPYPEYKEVLLAAAEDDNLLVQKAARKALVQAALPEAVAIFEACLRADKDTAHTDIYKEALEALPLLAERLLQAGHKEASGQAWLSIYRHAEQDALRGQALEHVIQNPVAEAFDIILDLADGDTLLHLPPVGLFGIALKAIAGDRVEEGQRLLEQALPQMTTTQTVQEALAMLPAHDSDPTLRSKLGIIPSWHIVGPFPWSAAAGFSQNYINEPQINLKASYTRDEDTLTWKEVHSADPGGLINLHSVLGAVDASVAFAFIQIEVEEGGPAQLRAGSDDGLRVWVNETLVWEKDADRGYTLDEDVVDIELRPGINSLLAAITQHAGGWAFGIRLTYPDGSPMYCTPVL